MADWLKICFSHPALVWGLCAFSLFAVLASLLLVPRYLATLPQDYLSADAAAPTLSVPLRILRNLLGATLIVLGVLMLFLPGQGLLTLLVGVLLVDLPGKHRIVQRFLSRPKVLAVVNKLRAHRNAPPLQPAA